MRIALVCDWYPPRRGGIEAHLEALGSRLVAAGHSVHVITSTPGSSGLTDRGVVVHRLSAPLVPMIGVVFLPSAIRQVGEILDRERIEVVHAHVSIVAPVGVFGATVAAHRPLPTAVTFHSFIPGTAFFAAIVGHLVGASDWKAVMTAVSSRVADDLRAFAPSNPIQILPNAIDTDFWTPGARSDHDGVNLVAVTRLRLKKRPGILIEAAKEIRRLLPDKRFTLRIAGLGPLEASLKRLVERDRLGDVIEFVGWKNAEELRALLRESDAFLSPTVREAFGIAALEAPAGGIPVIAMAHSAGADFITHEESGLPAPSDPEFLYASGRIVGDEGLRGD